MDKKKRYTVEDIQPIRSIIEHVRKRPGMYIGRVDERGNLEILKGLFEIFEECMHWKHAKFIYHKEDSFAIHFDAPLEIDVVKDLYSWFDLDPFCKFYLFQVIVALSDTYNIVTGGKKIHCKQGEIISNENVENYNTTIIDFSFDTTILRSKELPKHLLFNLFERYSFLYPEREILVFENETNIASFSSNGIQDWFETQSFDATLLMQPFHISIEDDLLDLKAEIVFSIHNEKESFSTITLPRADFIRDNGTHAVGFLKGLQNSIRKIIREDYSEPIFSEYRNPIGVFKVSYPAMAFYGPTRNEVGSEELVEIFENITQKKLLANEGFTNAILTLFNIK